MRYSLIVAMSENRVIGRAGELPWRLSADLRRFKRLTMGHHIVMGRKTYESIGRPLPGRVTMVLTRREDYDPGHHAVLVASSLDQAVALLPTTAMEQGELFVVGGAEVYRLALPEAWRLYRTVIHAAPAGDTYFPEIDPQAWTLLESRGYPADAKNEFACTHQQWQRNP